MSAKNGKEKEKVSLGKTQTKYLIWRKKRGEKIEKVKQS